MSKPKTRNAIIVASTCAWCGKRIPEGGEVFSLGAKARVGVNLDRQSGGVIQLTLAQPRRRVAAIVPTRDSPAKREGNDLLFAVCSPMCAQALKQALQRQIDLIDHIIN